MGDQGISNGSGGHGTGRSILLKNGKIVNDDLMFDCDVYIADGVIKQIGKDIKCTDNAIVVDCKGKFVMPGGIDANTNFEVPWMDIESVETFYTGSRAALAGGVTMVIDTAIKSPSKSLMDNYKEWRKRADAKICCDYALHVGVARWDDAVARDMEILAKEHGVNSFILYMAYTGTFELSDSDLYKAMDHIRSLGCLAMVHAENRALRSLNADKLIEQGVHGPEGFLLCSPEEIEGEAVNRAIVIAGQVNCPLYLLHIMSKTAAFTISEARKKGHIVYGEANAAALGTDGTHYFNPCWAHAAGHITNPPLRPDPSTGPTLMNYLANGDLSLCASDNRTFTTAQKKDAYDKGGKDFRLIPQGVSTAEHWMSMLWEKGVVSGKMDPCRFVAVSSTNAAKLFNLYPRKGRIQVGADADVVVWDPHVTRIISASTHHQASDFNVFEGMECHGSPVYVVSHGRLVVKTEGERGVPDTGPKGGTEVTLVDEATKAGSGRFLHTPPFSQNIYPKVQMRSKLNKACTVKRDESHSTNSEAEHVHVTEKHKVPTKEFNDGLKLKAENGHNSGFRTQVKMHQPPGGKSSGLW